jgi:hypothetical protein
MQQGMEKSGWRLALAAHKLTLLCKTLTNRISTIYTYIKPGTMLLRRALVVYMWP